MLIYLDTDISPSVHDIKLFQSLSHLDDSESIGSFDALEKDFSNFYENLVPFSLDLSSNCNLRDITLVGTGSPTVACLDEFSLATTSPGGTVDLRRKTSTYDTIKIDNSAVTALGGTDKPMEDSIQIEKPESRDTDADNHPRIAPVFDEQILESSPELPFSTPVLAKAGTWEIEILHKCTSLEPVPQPELHETEMRYAVLKFDYAFENSDASSVNAKSTSDTEWRSSKFNASTSEKVAMGQYFFSFDSSSNFTTKANNNTGGSHQYYDTKIQNSQNSSSVGRKASLKRGRDGEDQNGRRKREKKDQPPEKYSGLSETQDKVILKCPFLDGSPGQSETTVKSCNTCFPNLSKLKYALSFITSFQLEMRR